jgi:hypothetical protein
LVKAIGSSRAGGVLVSHPRYAVWRYPVRGTQSMSTSKIIATLATDMEL